MKLGIESAAYLNRYGLEKGAERMKKHGYDCVDYQDFCHTETEFFNLPEREFEKELSRQRAIINGAGIGVSQAHAPWRCPAMDSTPEERRVRFDQMAKAIRGCAYIGAENFVIHAIMPFGTNSPDRPDEMRDINHEFMSGLVDVAREYGNIVINLENLPFPSLPINHTCQVIDFVKRMNSPLFKVCIDTGHSNFCGEAPKDAVLLAGELLGTLHVHDNMGDRDSHLVPGKGNIDWQGFADALRRVNFAGTLSFETAAPVCSDPEETEKEEIRLAEIGKAMILGSYT